MPCPTRPFYSTYPATGCPRIFADLVPPLNSLTRSVPRAMPHASVSQHVPGHRLSEDRAVLGVVLPLLRALVYLHGLGVG